MKFRFLVLTLSLTLVFGAGCSSSKDGPAAGNPANASQPAAQAPLPPSIWDDLDDQDASMRDLTRLYAEDEGSLTIPQRITDLSQLIIASGAHVAYGSGNRIQTIETLADEIVRCGLRPFGPLCLDSAFTSAAIPTSTASKSDKRVTFYIETRNSTFLGTVLKHRHSSERFLMVIETTRSYSPNFRSVNVYAVDRDSSAMSIRENFVERGYPLAIEVEIPADFYDTAEQNLRETHEYRTLYHSAMAMLRFGGSWRSTSAIAQALWKKYQVITDSANYRYQTAFLELLRNRFTDRKDLIARVSSELLYSASPDVAQLAAITMSENGIVNPVARKLVSEALSSPHRRMRDLALRSFEGTKSNSQDEETLLRMIGDDDASISKSAADFARQINLKERHLSVLSSLMKHQQWKVRSKAVELISTIESHDATTQLILAMRDSNEDIRKSARRALDSREFRPVHVNDLITIINEAKDAETRICATRYLGKTESRAALSYLNSRFAIEADQDVIDETRDSIHMLEAKSLN